ncbi:hypothetical protein M2156_000346 [Streptomyces sp. SAI-149]|nr:hypothetical protein [Streptomyces sp. SAI-119]MDH6494127.1 hypothetical protein [Streptomyces sp. SAI-149]
MPLWSVTFRTHLLDGDTPVHGTQTWVLDAACRRDALLIAAARTQSEAARRHRRYAMVDTSTGHAAVWRPTFLTAPSETGPLESGSSQRPQLTCCELASRLRGRLSAWPSRKQKPSLTGGNDNH